MTNHAPSVTQNDVLPSSEDGLFVKQPQGNPHMDEAQQEQTIPQKSRGVVNNFPHPLAPDKHRPGSASLKEPLTNGRFTGNLLLSRPAFKLLELNQGFEYGPPTPIDPNHFLRRIGSPASSYTKDQPSRPRAGFPVSAVTAAKPMSPKPQLAGPKLNESTAAKHFTLPPPRPHHDLDPSIVRRVSNDTKIGKLPLKKKTSHTQDVELPFAPSPTIEAQGRVRNTNESAELMEPPFPLSPIIEAQEQDHDAHESAELTEPPFPLPPRVEAKDRVRNANESTGLMEPPFPFPPRLEAQGRFRNVNGSTELMELALPLPPRTETQERVRNVHKSPELRAAPFEQQASLLVDHRDVPQASRALGQTERAILKGGQERRSTHHTQALRGSEGTGSERSRNPETVDRQTSPGHSDRQRTTSDSNTRQHRHSDSTSGPLYEFPPQLAPAGVTVHDGSSHTATISEDDPAFRGSNVSKRRSTCPVSHQAAPSTHSSSDARSESFVSSPLDLAAKNTHELSTSMAKAINHFNISQKTEINRQKSHYKRKLRAFERKVVDREDIIAGKDVEITNQRKEMKALRDSITSLTDQVQSVEALLKEFEARNQSLMEENQALQDQLVKSADESQNLIDRVERRNGELTKEVQALKLSLKQLQDALSKKESREKELEEQTAQDQQEMENLYQQTSVLEQQLGDANHELALEKAKSQTFSEKLEDSKATSKNFEALFAQNEELVRRLDEQKTQIDTQCHRSTEESNSKLGAITERLESLTNTVSAQPDTLSNIENSQRESLNQVNSKLEAILESQSNAKESVGHLAKEIDESIGKIQKQLDHREEILAKQIEEKIKENSTLACQLSEKGSTCQSHEAALEKQKEHSSKLEAQTRDLEAALGLMEAEARERERQLDTFSDESKGLEEEIVSKDATIKDLETKLEKKSNAFEEKKEQHFADVLKFNQVLQEKDEASRIAINQAVDEARREALLDKEKEVEKVKNLLHQTQQHRDALSDQIGKLNEDSARSEELRRQDAITIASLRESLSVADNRCEEFTNEKLAHVSQLEQVKARGSATLETLKTEIVALNAQMVESERNTNAQIAKGQNLVAMLKQLAKQHGLRSIGEDLEKLFEGTISLEDMASTIAQVVNQVIGRQSSTTTTVAYRANSEPINNYKETDAVTQGSKMDVDLLSESKRVIVRSPAGFQLEPSPVPTVFQEKERRRQSLQPKSIMKRVTRSMAEPDWPTDSQEHVSFSGTDHPDMSRVPVERESSDPLGNSRANETTATHNTGNKSRKRSSGEATSSAPTSARRKRTRKIDQMSPQSVSEEDISNERLTEDKTQAKDIGSQLASRRVSPRRVQRGGRNSQSTPVVVGQGEAVAKQSSFRRQARQRTYGSQKNDQSTQLTQPTQSENQEDSQIDSLSNYWPPKLDSQGTINPLDDDEKGQGN